MSAPCTPFRVLLDASVPDSVGRAFASDGHEVLLHRDVLPDKTPDEVVCITALQNDAVLVAIDADMKQIARQYGMTPTNSKFDDLNLIRICCGEVASAGRIGQALTLIMLEWDFCCEKKPRRMWVDIGPHWIKTHR